MVFKRMELFPTLFRLTKKSERRKKNDSKTSFEPFLFFFIWLGDTLLFTKHPDKVSNYKSISSIYLQTTRIIQTSTHTTNRSYSNYRATTLGFGFSTKTFVILNKVESIKEQTN